VSQQAALFLKLLVNQHWSEVANANKSLFGFTSEAEKENTNSAN
jgi:hypothetical protein